jgi:hypothetical protein
VGSRGGGRSWVEQRVLHECRNLDPSPPPQRIIPTSGIDEQSWYRGYQSHYWSAPPGIQCNPYMWTSDNQDTLCPNQTPLKSGHLMSQSDTNYHVKDTLCPNQIQINTLPLKSGHLISGRSRKSETGVPA